MKYYKAKLYILSKQFNRTLLTLCSLNQSNLLKILKEKQNTCMTYPSKHSDNNPRSNHNEDQEEAHQQTMEYLEKQLKQVSASNSSHQEKYKMITNLKSTPLHFKLSLGTHGYLISYKSNQCTSAVVKIIILIVASSLMTIPLFYYDDLGQTFKLVIISLLYSIPLLYTLLFFLDPGTVLDHEEETFSEERIYCLTCEIYRNISTKHCSFCNRCCKKYDHHCSVFGKCIGKRNLLFFYLFIINTALSFIFYFIASVGQLYGQMDQKSSQP